MKVLETSSVKEVSWQSALETVGNVCSCDPVRAVVQLPLLLKQLQDGADDATSDQVKICHYLLT